MDCHQAGALKHTRCYVATCPFYIFVQLNPGHWEEESWLIVGGCNGIGTGRDRVWWLAGM